MERTLLLISLICMTASISLSQHRLTPMGYELYSWQDSTGGWNFSISYNTSREKTVKEVFNQKTVLRGVDQLKRRLSKLPNGASVFWLDRIPTGTRPKAKGSESLGYPPLEMIQEIQKYAEAHKIKVEVLSSQKKDK